MSIQRINMPPRLVLEAFLVWVQELFPDVVRDNPQYHYQQRRRSTEQQLWQLKRARGSYSCWRIIINQLTTQCQCSVTTSLVWRKIRSHRSSPPLKRCDPSISFLALHRLLLMPELNSGFRLRIISKAYWTDCYIRLYLPDADLIQL